MAIHPLVPATPVPCQEGLASSLGAPSRRAPTAPVAPQYHIHRHGTNFHIKHDRSALIMR
eukprot:2239922-Prorocentrum_lima.AAC.1